MLDDVFNYTNRTAQPPVKPSQDQHVIGVCAAIEQALLALTRALELLKSMQRETPTPQPQIMRDIPTAFAELKVTDERPVEEQKIIEGFFNGESMIDTSGRVYSVPANYASKSKLVEGDGMKLIVTHSGSFVYKQILPVDRQRLIGTLEQEESRDYYVRIGERRFRVLTASITYYKGVSGDEVIVLVSKLKTCTWAAVENIIKCI